MEIAITRTPVLPPPIEEVSLRLSHTEFVEMRWVLADYLRLIDKADKHEYVHPIVCQIATLNLDEL